MKRPYLKADRIPSIFPNCPAYLSKNIKRRKSPKKRKAISPKKQPKKRKLFEASENVGPNNIENEIPKDSENPSTSNNIQNEILENEEENQIPAEDEQNRNQEEFEALFDFIFNDKNSLLIPISWNRRQSNEGDFSAIELSKVTTRRIDNKLLFVSSKQIIVHQDLHVEIKVMGINVDLNSIGFENRYVSSTEEIEELVKRLDEVKICIRCASPDSKKNFENSFALHDSEGRLRHEKCTVILSKSEKTGKHLRCESCKKGRKVLTNKALRLQKRGEYQRISLKVSPNKKMKLEKLKQRYKNLSQKKCRYERLYRHYKVQLSNNQKEMASFDAKNLTDKLSNLKINKNEQTVISEILKASKCKSNKGRRYSEEWILLCLLFHMRTPAAYRLLRENGVLPLPCPSTARR